MANGKAVEKQQWEDLKKQIAELNRVLGFILFAPVLVLVGIAWGARAGVIAGTEKTLRMLKSWGE